MCSLIIIQTLLSKFWHILSEFNLPLITTISGKFGCGVHAKWCFSREKENNDNHITMNKGTRLYPYFNKNKKPIQKQNLKKYQMRITDVKKRGKEKSHNLFLKVSSPEHEKSSLVEGYSGSKGVTSFWAGYFQFLCDYLEGKWKLS